MAFASIVETARAVSPCSMMIPSDSTNKYLQMIGDYSIGGAVAGAAFRGMKVQSSTSKRASVTLTPRVMSGFGPGLALGLLAGMLVAGSDYLLDGLEKQRLKEEDQQRLQEEEEEAEVIQAGGKDSQRD
jgi:hypothetical protein